MPAEVIQKRGFYEITTEAGGKAKLDRVTTVLDWVLKDAQGAMAYYGGKLFAKWLTDEGEDWEEHYRAWKDSPFDPNTVLKARGDEGTSAHTLFGQLLEQKVKLTRRDHEWWVDPQNDTDIPFPARGYDLGVIEAYFAVYAEPDGVAVKVEDLPLSEVRLYWTEHPIDDCPKHDSRGRCTHGFSGTCDVYYPHIQIDDLKTHISGYRFSEWAQMAMYSLAANQLYDATICRQRIVLAHDVPIDDEENPFYGKRYEVQDDRFLSPDVGQLMWELYKYRRAWGPKK